MTTWAPGITLMLCPIPGCDWTREPCQPGPEESEMTLAEIFGLGVFAARVRLQRLQLDEEALRAHLGSHELLDWVVALRDAQEEAAVLRRNWHGDRDKLCAVRAYADHPSTHEPARDALLKILEMTP